MAEAAQVLRLPVTAAAATAPEIPREAAPNGTALGRDAGSCPRSGRAEAENQTPDRTHHYTRRTVRLRGGAGSQATRSTEKIRCARASPVRSDAAASGTPTGYAQPACSNADCRLHRQQASKLEHAIKRSGRAATLDVSQLGHAKIESELIGVLLDILLQRFGVVCRAFRDHRNCSQRVVPSMVTPR